VPGIMRGRGRGDQGNGESLGRGGRRPSRMDFACCGGVTSPCTSPPCTVGCGYGSVVVVRSRVSEPGTGRAVFGVQTCSSRFLMNFTESVFENCTKFGGFCDHEKSPAVSSFLDDANRCWIMVVLRQGCFDIP